MRFLDTDILIDFLRRLPAAIVWFNSVKELFYISGFSVMELIEGCSNAQEVHRVQKFTKTFAVVWPEGSDCQRALADFSQYHLSHRLGLLDSMIAATAIGQKATLCTFNIKHYSAVPGLTIEQPYQR